jgi:hypothetical protein
MAHNSLNKTLMIILPFILMNQAQNQRSLICSSDKMTSSHKISW